MDGMSDTPLWERSNTDREHFRATFDDDADAYDRTRPVCPAAVFDDIVELAGLGPTSHVLEIGPGTGQATRPLAERRSLSPRSNSDRPWPTGRRPTWRNSRR